ncbi:transmembrane protein [Planoprotostelium fungivorum]|uniref:Transmembrane protein n=1 Tax=Planoprotostelium fungivorum TaxID=1890364 RepID=A0A2P6NUD3_9EUKA|nr:transmembrane protein [Planoprotostelium fungivorum]
MSFAAESQRETPGDFIDHDLDRLQRDMYCVFGRQGTISNADNTNMKVSIDTQLMSDDSSSTSTEEPPFVQIDMDIASEPIQHTTMEPTIYRHQNPPSLSFSSISLQLSGGRKSSKADSYRKQLEREMTRALQRKDRDEYDSSDAGQRMTTDDDRMSVVNYHSDSPLENLPDEVLIRIWSFLDPPSIGRTAQVSRRLRDISYDIPMWRDNTIHWMQNKTQGLSLDQLHRYSYSFFVRQFVSFRKGEKKKEEEVKREQKVLRDQRRRTRASRIMKAASYGRVWEWICAICVVLFTILLVLRLQDILQCAWSIVFIPLFFIMAQLLLAPTLYDAFRTYYDYNFDTELEPDEEQNRVCGPIFFYLAFPAPLQVDPKTSRCFIYPSVTLITLWIILLVLKLDGTTSLPHWAVFLPLIITTFLWSQLPLWVGGFSSILSDSRRIDRILGCSVILSLAVFLILLVLKLDGRMEETWYVVMSPLWVGKGIFMMTPIFFTVVKLWVYLCGCGLTCCRSTTRFFSHWGTLCVTFLGISTMVLVPLLVFEILMAQLLQGIAHPFAVVFIPIFVIEGFILCGCCVVNCAFLCSD